MSRRSICVLTGSRADYGLLYHPMRAIEASPHFDLQIAVTGMHLAPEFGRTVQSIEQDGMPIAGRVEMLTSSDTAVGVAKSMALGTAGFADLFDRLRPDLVLLLGDRFEMLAAASAALVAAIPMAHLCGGDVTEGAYDESIRHALTKFAHFHFVTNEPARRRVVQLGENPDRVHLVGSPGLDYIRHFTPTPRQDIADRLGVDASRPWLLVTFHPATRDAGSPAGQMAALLAALEAWLAKGFAVIATLPNADNEGRALGEQLGDWSAGHAHAHAFPSLGQQLYLSVMAEARAVIGNSSSGLYEAPSFKRPTVNIGSRQRGRLKAESVIDSAAETGDIDRAIAAALALDCSSTLNPYGDGSASERIVDILAGIPDFRAGLAKTFFDAESA